MSLPDQPVFLIDSLWKPYRPAIPYSPPYRLILFSPFSNLSFFVFLSPFPYDVTTCHFHSPILFSGDSISAFHFWIAIPSPKLTPIMRTIYIRPVVAPNKKISLYLYLMCVQVKGLLFSPSSFVLLQSPPCLLLVSTIFIPWIPQVLTLSPSCLQCFLVVSLFHPHVYLLPLVFVNLFLISMVLKSLQMGEKN